MNLSRLAKPSLWRHLQSVWYRKRLSDPRFAFLYAPPPDEDWVCFDCETTGLNPKKDQIISIGAVRIRGQQILHSQRLELMIQTTRPISPESIPIHQIRDQDTREGLSPREALLEFLSFIGSRPLVGYYIDFDIAMIDALMQQELGVKLSNRRLDVSGLYYDQKIGLIPQKPLDLRFDTLMEKLDLPKLEKHDAYQDALMTAMIFVKLTAH